MNEPQEDPTPMVSSQLIPNRKPVGQYECKHCLKRHPNGWYCRYALQAERDDMRERAAKAIIANDYWGSHELAKRIRAIK